MSFKRKANSLETPKQTTHKGSAASSRQGAPAHTFLCPSMAATQIHQWEVNTRACVYVREVAFVAVCVFPSVPCAGATGELDSVSVIEILCTVISTTSDRFDLRSRF